MNAQSDFVSAYTALARRKDAEPLRAAALAHLFGSISKSYGARPVSVEERAALDDLEKRCVSWYDDAFARARGGSADANSELPSAGTADEVVDAAVDDFHRTGNHLDYANAESIRPGWVNALCFHLLRAGRAEDVPDDELSVIEQLRHVSSQWQSDALDRFGRSESSGEGRTRNS